MKNKLFKKPNPDSEEKKSQQTAEEAEVSASGPSIAAVKKNKMLVILASSLLITIVIYFLFFKGDDKPKQNLQEVIPVQQRAAPIAASDTGKSPFALDVQEKPKDESISVLNKPQTPDVPKLPDLPADSVADDSLKIPELNTPEQVTQQQAQQQVQALQMQNQASAQFPQIAAPAPNAPQQQGAGQAPQMQLSDPRYAPIVVVSGGAGPSRSVGYDNNIISLNGDPIKKLDNSVVETKTTFVANRNQVIAQGKLLTAVLETAINTELQGFVRAIVSHDVYGEAGSDVLIPRGSRLFGNYSSQVQRGQARVQINWTRLIRPDGVDLAISSVASDQFGRAGIPGYVDNKYTATVTNSILSSILAVGSVAAVQGLIGNAQSTTTTNPQLGSTTTTGNAATQAVYNVSKTITDTITKVVTDNLNIAPTISVPQGTRITVIVNADMNIPPMKK